MSVKLLTEHHLEFLSLKGGYTGSSESTLFKMLHCWKSRVAVHMLSNMTMSTCNGKYHGIKLIVVYRIRNEKDENLRFDIKCHM